MSDILLLKRTVFLPKGSPGIFSINDIKVDIRNVEVKGENGNIYCLGDCDILLEYLSMDTEKDLKRGIMLTEDLMNKNSEPRPWQALLTLPFELVEEGEMICPPLSELEVLDVKWFVVAPRAVELEVTIKLLPDEAELKASNIYSEFSKEAPSNFDDEIYMKDQIYFGLDDHENQPNSENAIDKTEEEISLTNKHTKKSNIKDKIIEDVEYHENEIIEMSDYHKGEIEKAKHYENEGMEMSDYHENEEIEKIEKIEKIEYYDNDEAEKIKYYEIDQIGKAKHYENEAMDYLENDKIDKIEYHENDKMKKTKHYENEEIEIPDYLENEEIKKEHYLGEMPHHLLERISEKNNPNIMEKKDDIETEFLKPKKETGGYLKDLNNIPPNVQMDNVSDMVNMTDMSNVLKEKKDNVTDIEDLKDMSNLLKEKKEYVNAKKVNMEESVARGNKDNVKANQFSMRLCRVLEGENLESIAHRLGVTAKSLAHRNRISDSDIKEGMYLIIPQ